MNRPMQASLGLLLLGMLAASASMQAEETPRQQARQMDANIDGTLSADEHEAGVEMSFDSVDTDGDSFISADELDAARDAGRERGTGSSADRIAVLDIDRDGRLSETEHAVGAKEVFREADASRDGNLSPEEIKAADEAATPPAVTP